MKTTIEISDAIYRQIKARAGLRGITVRAYFTEALQEKLESESRNSGAEAGWMKVFGQADTKAVDEVQAIIDAEFSKIDPSDWK